MAIGGINDEVISRNRRRLLQIHKNMKSRCYNKNNPQYKDYGGRGIYICDEWRGHGGFANFYDWAIHNGYDESLSIDRIDNDDGYFPDNCRWADMVTQANNRRSCVYHEFNGESHTFSEWAKIVGIDHGRLRNRHGTLGWSIEDTLTIPVGEIPTGFKGKELTVNGETHTIKEWCDKIGIEESVFFHRVNTGSWSVERAVTEPCHTQNPELNGKQITINGETHNVTTWCEINKIPIHIYKSRKSKGWDIERAVTEKYVDGRRNRPKKPFIPSTRRNVICIETGEVFRNMHDAAKAMGVSYGGIRNVICGIAQTCGGYTWKKVNADG